MLALFGATIVVAVFVNFLFIRRRAVARIPTEPKDQQGKPTDPENPTLSARSDDEPGKALMRRARYILRQNTEDSVSTIEVPAGTDAPNEVCEPEKDGKRLAIVSQETGDLSWSAGEMPGSTAVSRSHLGQQAMSYAMRYPEPGKRGVRNRELSELADSLGIKKRSLNDRVYKARLVLRYNEEAVPLVMNGALSLWKAYHEALDLKRRKNGETSKEPRERAQRRPIARPQEQEIAEAA
jgi:hypothetical protein